MDFKQQLESYPKQFEWEPKIENKKRLPKKWDDILICGMGGSALGGLLLQKISPDKKIGVQRDYVLPNSISKNTFVIIVSYSGNTEEALSAYREATDKNLSVGAVASGGMLEKIAQKNITPFIKIPAGVQPRIALGYLTKALVEFVGAPKPKDIKIDTPTIEQEAQGLAKKIGQDTPLFYASDKNNVLAYIAKIQINENAKRHAFYNVFPELNHNELEGYEESKKFFVVILRDIDDDERIKKRIELTAKLIKQKGYGIDFIDIKERGCYNKIIYSTLFTNWLSYHLAINAGVDPEPVDLIEQFKKEL